MKIAHIHVWDQKNKGDVAIVIAVQQLLHQQFDNLEIIDLPIEFLSQGATKQIQQANQADLLVIGGGGILYDYFLPFKKEIIDAIQVPLVVYGVGYIQEIGAQPLSQHKLSTIRHLIDKADLVGVRDDNTQEFLGDLNVNKECELIGDPSILLQTEKPDNFEMPAKVNIGLNLNYSGWLGFGKYEHQILKSYQQVGQYFGQTYDADIYYAVHHPGERDIIKKLDLDFKILDLPPTQQVYAYSQLDMMIGMMLHSCVLAFGAGIPFVNVGYDVRNRSFAEFIDMPELTVMADELKDENLLSTTKEVFSQHKEYQYEIRQLKKEIQHKHQRFLQQINKLV